MAVSDRVKSGPEKAPHRSLWKALGLTDEELKLPLIGVVSAKSECVPGHNHLNNIAQAVKDGIRLAGGVPVEFPAIGVCDGIAMGHVGMKYSLASRELIADSCESMAMAHGFDGMVFIPNCDKIVPGMLMAARRLNLPAMVISGGPMMPGRMPGGSGDMDLNSVFEAVGAYKAGKMDDTQLNAVESAACPGCGSCSGMFTANSMNCITEVIGMALPGNGTIAAVDAARIRLAKKTGMRVVELVREGLTPEKIMTESAFRNALCLDMALGCSTNTVLHLPAIAHEAGIDFDLNWVNEASAISRQSALRNADSVMILSGVRPSLTSSTMRMPVFFARRMRAASTAAIVPLPGSAMPMTSVIQFMELAVTMPEQLPQPGPAEDSTALS